MEEFSYKGRGRGRACDVRGKMYVCVLILLFVLCMVSTGIRREKDRKQSFLIARFPLNQHEASILITCTAAQHAISTY